jgi:Chaperone of endosialidase/Major tropism determinant N-terminal domain
MPTNAITITSDTIIKLLIRRGTDSERKNAILDVGELGYTTDTGRVYVGTGSQGGVLVGNLGRAADSGPTYKEAFPNPQPGDIVFETTDRATNPSYRLFIRSTSNSWLNVHPRYDYPFDYSAGKLNFNNKYLTLNEFTGNFGINTLTPSSLLTVNGDADIANNVTIGGDVTVTNAVIRNRPTTGAHATNKGYTDNKFFPISSYPTIVQPWVVTHFLPLSGGTMTGNIDTNGNRIVVSYTPGVNYDVTNKEYVDRVVAANGAGVKGYVHQNFLPLSGGTVGPVSGTSTTMQPALDLRNAGGGPHLVAGIINGGDAKFTIKNSGDVDINGSINIQNTATVNTAVLTPTVRASSRVGIGLDDNNQAVSPITTLDVRGGVNIGRPGLEKSATSDSLTFNGIVGNLSNTDLIALYRQNTDTDTTEFRTQIGDNTNEDSFVVGSAPANTWGDWLRVKYGSMYHRGDISAGGVVTAGTNVTVGGNINFANNSTGITFKDNKGGTPYLQMQSDNNFVFYGTKANGDPRALFSVMQRQDNPTFYLQTPTQINGNLNVAGAIFATGDVTAYSTSDERLKNNVQPITSALEKVEQISGVEYDWNTELQSTYTGHDVGVLAQEIEKILPEAVTTREDGYKAVRYEKVVPLLIQAIKELKAIVDSK